MWVAASISLAVVNAMMIVYAIRLTLALSLRDQELKAEKQHKQDILACHDTISPAYAYMLKRVGLDRGAEMKDFDRALNPANIARLNHPTPDGKEQTDE